MRLLSLYADISVKCRFYVREKEKDRLSGQTETENGQLPVQKETDHGQLCRSEVLRDRCCLGNSRCFESTCNEYGICPVELLQSQPYII